MRAPRSRGSDGPTPRARFVDRSIQPSVPRRPIAASEASMTKLAAHAEATAPTSSNARPRRRIVLGGDTIGRSSMRSHYDVCGTVIAREVPLSALAGRVTGPTDEAIAFEV